MIRFIFVRHQLYSPGAAEDITCETVLLACPEVERRLNRGGAELHGLHDFTRLLGAEIVSDDDIAGYCEKCDGPILHRPGKPGEYDHACEVDR